jgi:hypothetical protein
MSEKFIQDILASSELDIQTPVCDLTALFKNIKILDSSTSSSTVQVIAVLNDRAKTSQLIKEYVETSGKDKVFVKIGFYEPGDNSAEIEQMIYKYLKKLLFMCRTPNIMRYVVGYRCNNFLDALKLKSLEPKNRRYYTRMVSKVEELVEREKELGLDGNKATITLVELGQGDSLDKLLESGNLTEDQFTSVMFQTFYTLREFHLNKVRHNDIHLGNIWVEIYLSPQRLIYFVNDGMYAVLETTHVVKLYDFDRAGFTVGPFSNQALSKSFCPQFGMCENENERFDLLIVATYLYQNWGDKYPFILDFVFNVVHNPDYLEGECCLFPGRYCDLKLDPETSKIRCSPTAVIETNGIYNIEQLCEQTEVFDSYLRFWGVNGFEDRDIPITKPAKSTDIPLYTFTTKFYVSSACSLTPIDMANMLLKEKR